MAQVYGNRRWRALREWFLRDHATCRLCEETGRTTLATVVDHIRPHKGDQTLFWDTANLQALCKPCHDGAKQQLERVGYLRGSRADGVPLDAGHHWRAG